MLLALLQVHEQNATHNDVKPENFRCKDGIVIITDFGILKTMEGDDRLKEGALSPFDGSLHYCSVSSHKWVIRTYRDDYISLAYTILSLIVYFYKQGPKFWFELPDDNKLREEFHK